MVMSFKIGVSTEPNELWNVALNKEKRIFVGTLLLKFIIQLHFPRSGSIFFLYSHNNYNDKYNTESKGAWKYITTLRLTLNIETLNIQK